MNWAATALARLSPGEPFVLVTVAGAQGSTPRAAGTKMLVLSSGSEGTIGGGRLEHKAIALARQMLAAGAPALRLKRYNLGPELNQCCGGNMQLLFEYLDESAEPWLRRWASVAGAKEPWSLVTEFDGKVATRHLIGPGQASDLALPAAVRQQIARRGSGLVRTDLAGAASERLYYVEPNGPALNELYLFGAGHVGKAIARQFEQLPFRIAWIDSRPDAFPVDLASNVSRHIAPLPPEMVEQAPSEAFYLVMTHSHPLDLEICARILGRGDFKFLGLIGSDTKRARFASRLRAIGIPDQSLARLICPIGLPGLDGKEPATIAVAVAAQLLTIGNSAAQQATGARRHVLVHDRITLN
ncbi:MAG: xanthine dehydrogenase accessory protein XdhC [Dongiaceae bacterium]